MAEKLLLKSSGLFVAFIFFLLGQNLHAQLTDFTLTLTPTNETCTGNGSISFNVSNTTEGATIIYTVYLLPNTTTPLATLSASSLNGLAAGDYHVVATQTLGNLTNSDQEDITIINNIVPLAYQLSGTINCNDGVITANVTQGNAVNYEITSGPVIRPLQPSNVFALLPPGVYVVRVYDACGDAVVQTYTLQNNPVDLLLSGISFPECELINCNTIGIETTLIAGLNSIINYPLSIRYTVFPPTGVPIILTQTVASGSPGSQDFSMGIPFFNNQAYTCNVEITDHCGNVVSSNNNQIDREFDLNMSSDVQICIKNLKLAVCNYVPPINVSFLSAPAGFNPLSFNGNHPGPFTDVPIEYGGAANPLPNGTYSVQVTDACGRIAQNEYTITESTEPGYLVLLQGCGSGQISMPDPIGPNVASVIMNSAPASFNHSVPYDVSFNISNGLFVMQQLPSGIYTFTVVSVCGITYNYTIEIPLPPLQPVLISNIKGCDTGFGSISMGVQSSSVITAIITAAPTSFTQTLPYDVSFNLFGGKLFMNSLPEGLYSFYIKDSCNGERTITIDVPGYHTLLDHVVVGENCGSFDIQLDYDSNENVIHDYWLQKLNPITGQWMHPINGNPYTEGSLPIALNSLSLTNHFNNLNIASTGTFRILKVHHYYANGSDIPILCIKDIKDFTFTGGPRIITAYSLPCLGNSGQVAIVAEGLAPLTYFITTKDGQPFEVNNGNASTFAGLAPGIYNFQVQDVCGNIVNRLFDLGSIPPLVITQSILCDGQNGQLSVPGLPFLNFQWWQGTSTTILSTTNTLSFTPFVSAVHSGIYHVRIYSNQPGLCADQVISFTIPDIGNSPNAGEGTTLDLCGSSGTIDLFSLLTGNFATTGTWQEITNSGMQIGHSWLPVGIPYGTYQFNYTVNGLCATSDESTVIIHFNPIPVAPVVSANDPVCSSETLQLSASDIPNASYLWTGPNGFTSNEQNPAITDISAAASGSYSVMASIGPCDSPLASVNVNVLASPEFSIKPGCNGNEYAVIVIPNENSFNPAAVSYSWSGPENYTSTANPIIITGGKKGIYSVTVTAENGCIKSASIEVLNTLCAIPNGISPNNDGDNDTFDLTGFEVIKFKIFSRYGRMVFEQDDYTNQWHGQDYDNRELPDATYYYYIRMKSGEEKTGWVYVTK